jgi:hypothetical protein
MSSIDQIDASYELKQQAQVQASSQTPSEKIVITSKQSPVKQATPSTLRYPKDIKDREADYVMFNFYDYKPPYNSTAGDTSNSTFYNNYSGSGTASGDTAKGYDPIILYMPQDISTSFGGGWNGFGVGAASIGALNVTNPSGLDVLNGIKNIPGMGVSTFANLIKSLTNNFTGSELTVNQALSSTSGRIINPNVELLYEAPKLRNFGLKFKLVSTRKEESDEIRKIYNTFKKATLPGFGAEAFSKFEAGNLLTLPKLCQVDFMKGNARNTYLPYYKLCGITALDINFTADGTWAAFANGDPVSVEITLGFLETKIAFSQEVDENGGGI